MRFIRPILTTSAAIALACATLVPPAMAAELDVSANVSVDRTSLSGNERFQVTVDFTVPNSAQPGDTFTLTLGPGLKMESGAVDLKDPATGEVVARVTTAGSNLVYTFTNYVADHDNIKTTLAFWSSIKSGTTEVGESVSVDVLVNGTAVDGPDVTMKAPGTDGSHYEFKWMNWTNDTRTDAVFGIVVLKRHYDIDSLSVTDTPGPGLKIKCDAAGWPQVFVGPTRSVFGKAEGWRYKLPADRYTVDCTPEAMTVTLTPAPGNPAVPAFHDFEVRGLVTATETLDSYTNTATIVENEEELPIKTGEMSRFAASGSAYGNIASVSVGDLVWLDRDRDGIQDAGEPGIPGVVLTIKGPDGNPVKDVKGVPVGPVTTDADGKYKFENLPLLKPGEAYTVTVDEAASAGALAGRVPTKANAGSDTALDSSTGSASSTGLTKKGESDLTLDFGYQVRQTPPPPPPIDDEEDVDPTPDPDDEGTKPTDPPSTDPDVKPDPDTEGTKGAAPTPTPTPVLKSVPNKPQLARTGAEVGLLALMSGAFATAGGGLLAWRRRRDQ